MPGEIKGVMRPPAGTDLKELFHREGLELLGVAAADPCPEEEERYRAELSAGRAGAMDYLARHAALKFDPPRILAGCRAIIVAGLCYEQPAPPPLAPRLSGTPEPRGTIAKYAWGRDYHKVLGERLHRIAVTLERRTRGERFACFTDATPLAERFYAARAGIGFTGRHGLLISSAYGSWFVIGEILTTAPLDSFVPLADGRGACPPSCRRCLAACPTRALDHPFTLDAPRCISYLTIENRGSIDPALRPLLGDRVFGCDACQEACPNNQNVQSTRVRDFLHHRAGPSQPLAALLDLRDHADVVRRFAGSPLVRAGRRGLVRNACVAAANTGSRELVPELRRLSSDQDLVVAEHAAWAVSVLSGRGPQESSRSEEDSGWIPGSPTAAPT